MPAPPAEKKPGLAAFLEAIRSNALGEVAFDRPMDFSVADLTEMGEAIKKNKKIVRLSFKGSQVDRFSVVAAVFAKNPRITELDLSNTALTFERYLVEAFTAFFKSLPPDAELKTVRLDDVDIERPTIDAIARAAAVRGISVVSNATPVSSPDTAAAPRTRNPAAPKPAPEAAPVRPPPQTLLYPDPPPAPKPAVQQQRAQPIGQDDTPVRLQPAVSTLNTAADRSDAGTPPPASAGLRDRPVGMSTPVTPRNRRGVPPRPDFGMSPVRPPPPVQQPDTVYPATATPNISGGSNSPDASMESASTASFEVTDQSADMEASTASSFETTSNMLSTDSSAGGPAVVQLTPHEESVLAVCKMIASTKVVAFTAQEVRFLKDTCGAMDTAWGGRWGEHEEHTKFELETHIAEKQWLQVFTDPLFRPIHYALANKPAEMEIYLIRQGKPPFEQLFTFNQGGLQAGADLLRRFFNAAPCHELLARGITANSSALFAGAHVHLHVLKRLENGTEPDARAGIEMAQRLQALFARRQ